MAWSFSIGEVRGTTLRIHLTFLLLLLWVGLTHAVRGQWAAAADGVLLITLVFACVVLHELGHAMVARRFGVKTPDIILLPIGGVARMERIPEEPSQELAIALAGPAVNIVIAGLLFLLLGGIPPFEPVSEGGAAVPPLLPRLAWINLSLAVFNMLPALPMDGGRVLRAVLSWRLGHLRATQVAASIGQALALLLGLLGLLGGAPLLAFIALFVYLGATAEAHGVQMQEFARGVPVSAAMMTRFRSLPDDATLADAAAELIHGSQHDFPVLDRAGRLIGMLTRDAVIQGMYQADPRSPVTALMLQEIRSVHPRQSLADALPLLQGPCPVVAVLDDDGALAGLLTAENIGELVMLHAMRRAGQEGPLTPWP